jgi:ABC-type nitrate/sulfonate/bicarbonate transport system substrate-binding protein
VVDEKYDSETMKKIQGVLREAVDLINHDKRQYAHLLLNDLPDDLRPQMTLDDLHVDRLRYVYPRAYSQERYEKQAEWMVQWGLLDEGVRPEAVLSATC